MQISKDNVSRIAERVVANKLEARLPRERFLIATAPLLLPICRPFRQNGHYRFK
jgi:hypothetical protein